MDDGGVRRNTAIELSRRRRRWLSLGVTGVGVITIVAAAAIVGVFKSGSPGGGVAHTVVTPAALGPYKWAPDLEKNAGLATLAASAAKMSGGQATDIRARAYERPAPGGTAPQLLEVIAGRLPGTSPASSVVTLIRSYPGGHIVPAGPMGGSAACFERTAGPADSVAMCAWSDNDSFAILASPALSAASLAHLMVQDRPLIELARKQAAAALEVTRAVHHPDAGSQAAYQRSPH